MEEDTGALAETDIIANVNNEGFSTFRLRTAHFETSIDT